MIKLKLNIRWCVELSAADNKHQAISYSGRVYPFSIEPEGVTWDTVPPPAIRDAVSALELEYMG